MIVCFDLLYLVTSFCMWFTKVKAQKCLLKATNHTEPKCFTSICHPGWVFFQDQGIFTHRKHKRIWKSHCHIVFLIDVFGNGSKLW